MRLKGGATQRQVQPGGKQRSASGQTNLMLSQPQQCCCRQAAASRIASYDNLLWPDAAFQQPLIGSGGVFHSRRERIFWRAAILDQQDPYAARQAEARRHLSMRDAGTRHIATPVQVQPDLARRRCGAGDPFSRYTRNINRRNGHTRWDGHLLCLFFPSLAVNVKRYILCIFDDGCSDAPALLACHCLVLSAQMSRLKRAPRGPLAHPSKLPGARRSPPTQAKT